MTEFDYRTQHSWSRSRRVIGAYILMERLRTVALKGTALAQASAGTIRLRLCKLAARVEVSVRRLRVRLAESAPVQAPFAHAWRRLRPAPG